MDNKNNSRSIIGKRRPKKTSGSGQPKVSNTSQETKVFTSSKSKSSSNTYPTKKSSSTIQKTNVSANNRAKERELEFQRRRKAANRKGQIVSGSNRTQKNSTTSASKSTNLQSKSATKPKVKTKRSLKSTLIKVLIFVLLIFAALTFSVYAYAKFTPLNPDLSGNVELYDISSNAAAVAASHRIANIAIFGVDGREDVEGDRSDAIMIGSADFEHSKLKITSLMRDTYVEIADEDYFDKLNAAYAVGGPEEALRTINLNFDTAITDYVVFDFTALVAMVNAVGGVDIEITDEDELYWLNQYLMDVNDKVGTQDPDVPGIGVQHLTGSQALSYARIRYAGNGDYDRTQRQRNILQNVVARAASMNIAQQISLVQDMLPYIQTSLRTSEIVKYALNVLMMPNKNIEQSRLPQDGLMSDGYLDGVSYIFPDTLVDNIKAWYQFVYEIDYTPSVRAQDISEEIEYVWY